MIEEVPAGKVPTKAVGAGEAIRIFTGAPVPDGADAIVMQEDTQRTGDTVRITDTAVKPRQYVYARGTEMRAGAVVLSAGTPAVSEYYDAARFWPESSLERRRALRAKRDAARDPAVR